MLEPLLSKEQAADILGVSERTVKRFIQAGDLEVIQVGGRCRIEPQALRDFIASRRGRREPVRSP